MEGGVALGEEVERGEVGLETRRVMMVVVVMLWENRLCVFVFVGGERKTAKKKQTDFALPTSTPIQQIYTPSRSFCRSSAVSNSEISR